MNPDEYERFWTRVIYIEEGGYPIDHIIDNNGFIVPGASDLYAEMILEGRDG